jgi:hypothetical protein
VQPGVAQRQRERRVGVARQEGGDARGAGAIQLPAQVRVLEIGGQRVVAERRRGFRVVRGRAAFGGVERGAEGGATIGERRGIGDEGQQQDATREKKSHARQSRT